jgi:hypothetical protein
MDQKATSLCIAISEDLVDKIHAEGIMNHDDQSLRLNTILWLSSIHA